MTKVLILRVKPCQHESLAVSLSTARLAVVYAARDDDDQMALRHTLRNLDRLLAAVEEAEANEESTDLIHPQDEREGSNHAETRRQIL